MSNLWVNNVSDYVEGYLSKLQKENFYQFFPALNNLTKYGKELELGFSCFGLKIYYILGLWDKLSLEDKDEWIGYLSSFQIENPKFPVNSYLDTALLASYSENKVKNFAEDSIKSILNIFPHNNYETNNKKLLKAVNAETKQAISTINQVKMQSKKNLENIFTEDQTVEQYLNQYDWSKPWNAGAQFSSLCVYSQTQNYEIKKELIEFINTLADDETGSYFSDLPKNNREIINGAMKVISGLDWLQEEIHYPEKLIDYCLSNRPILEGCDVVDYVYVLFKCSQQTDFKRQQVNNLLLEQLSYIKSLFNSEEGGFSYFINQSQTHYYGVEIVNKTKQADIHGTILCLWAISMISKNLDDDKIKLNFNLIKP